MRVGGFLYILALHIKRRFFVDADDTILKLRGESATLSCPIDAATCGELHSIKWFKGSDRVAVVSGDGSVQNVEGAFSGK